MNRIKPLNPGVRNLSPDLWPRAIRSGKAGNIPAERVTQDPMFSEPGNRQDAPPDHGNALYLTRNFIGQSFSVGTTAVRLIKSTNAWPYILLNPSTSIGLTSSVAGFNATAADADLSTSIGIAGYNSVHMTLDVTAITGGATWDIYAQSFDSISGNWADTQAVFTNITTTGTTYAFPDQFGMGTDIRFRFDRTAGAGTLTCSIGLILKEGVGGSTAGLAQTVYLGGPDVTTVSGFPLLEGDHQMYVVREGVELWAVALTTINIRVFQI